MKVLVVEDDSTTRKLLCAMLSRRPGYEPVPATSAEEAQELYRESFFPLVILDLHLPRMTGIGFSEWLRHQPNGDRTYILVATAQETEVDGVNILQQILDAGADDYIAKPYRPVLLDVRLAVAEKQIAHMEQRKTLASALQEEKDFVSAVIETTAVFIVVLDLHLNIIRVNPAFQKIAEPHSGYFDDLQKALLAAEIFPTLLSALQGKLKPDSSLSFQTETGTPDGRICISWTASIVIPETSTEGLIICSGIDITERQKAEDRLAYLALRDPLTGCYNRNYLMEGLETARQQADSGVCAALLSIDLDNFKIVNDTAGHQAGDRLLVAIVRLFLETLVVDDDIIRLGGDEFLVILNGVSRDQAGLVAERLRQRVDDFVFVSDGKSFRVTVSIGIAMIEAGLTAEQVLSRADAACYVAKAKGRNCVKFYSPAQTQNLQIQSDITWRDTLRRALREDKFELWYQPIAEVNSGRIVLREALLRLPGSDGQFILPQHFFPAAARLRLMPQIDRYVIGKVARDLVLHPDLAVSLNLSAHSLAEEDLVSYIVDSFRPIELYASRICIEVTEDAIIADLGLARDVLSELTTAGFRFALDDFGAGFSSFSHLRHLPLNYLKIDGSFIVDLKIHPANRAFVRAISQLARDLQIETVAEYVENEETLQELKLLGINLAQGFHIGRPAPLA